MKNAEFALATAYRPPDSIAAEFREVLEEFLSYLQRNVIHGSDDETFKICHSLMNQRLVQGLWKNRYIGCSI